MDYRDPATRHLLRAFPGEDDLTDWHDVSDPKQFGVRTLSYHDLVAVLVFQGYAWDVILAFVDEVRHHAEVMPEDLAPLLRGYYPV